MDDRNDPRACPVCECCHSYTIYTRLQAAGRVARRRECRHCGRRWTTYEVTVSQAHDPRDGGGRK